MSFNYSYLEKYFSLIEKSNTERLENPELSEEIRKRVKIREENLLQIKDNIQWLMMSPEDRHAARIEWVASLRKRNIEVSSYLQYIAVYDKIQVTLPYIKVLNRNGQLDNFISFCLLIIERIDFQGKLLKKVNIDENEINDALLDLETKIHLAQSTHPESVEKAIELSRLLKEVFLSK